MRLQQEGETALLAAIADAIEEARDQGRALIGKRIAAGFHD